MIRNTALLLTGSAVLASTSALAGASTPVQLNDLAHGTIVNGSEGGAAPLDFGTFTVDGDNFHNESIDDFIVVFDTTQTGTRDPDLQGPNGSGSGAWSVGNLANSVESLGNILIIQEFDRNFAGFQTPSGEVVNSPDDERRRTGGSQVGAGEISFNFTQQVTSFGFTLVDIEETGEFNDETGFFAVFSDGNDSTKVAFADFIDSNSIFYDPSVQFGNNSANRIAALTAADLGLDSIQSATLNFGGSGGVGDLVVTGVPSPTAAIAGVALMGVLIGRRGNRRQDRVSA